MTTVAIASVGNIGLVIYDALKEDPQHKVILLARKKPETDEDLPVTVVDYSDIDAISKVLETNDVHTVISTISVMSPEASVSEVNLVKAAAKSGPTKRFVASDWGIRIPDDPKLQLPQKQLRAHTDAELRKTDLEWTRFYNGFLLDYYGMPYVDTRMRPFAFVVDMAAKTAAIPGSGNDPMRFTYTRDLGRFVVAALGLPAWETQLYCYSDRTNWNDFIKVAEEMRDSSFNIVYDSIEKLENGEITELPSHVSGYAYFPKQLLQSYLAMFGRYVIHGVFDFPEEKTLNMVFPEIKTTTVRDMVGYWKGK